jgi:hypothetical protein
MNTKKFEYLPMKIAQVAQHGGKIEGTNPTDEVARLVRGMNALGSQGWELCGMLPPPIDMWIFKRQLPEEKPQIAV